MAANGVIENTVVRLWEKVAAAGCEMLTEDGQTLNILYSGRISDESGGDFKDAVIELDGKQFRGNIEIHTHSRDWQAHGHHWDAAYNAVILHVVMWHDNDITLKENGRTVSQIALAKFSDNDFSGADIFYESNLPCLHRGGTDVISLLEIAGEQRFLEKTASFQKRLERTDFGECLYQGIMEALGYSRNKESFSKLAKAVPLKMLESGMKLDDGIATVQSILLGSAGLLPSQRADTNEVSLRDSYVEKLESSWRDSHLQAALPFSSWQFFKVRPGNHPVRRVVGMSYLIASCRSAGLLKSLTGQVFDNSAEVENALKVAVAGYWVNRFDFGKICYGLGGDLIGNSRASEIIINVLMPFMHAWKNESPDAMSLYHSYPPACENTVGKHMRKQLGLRQSEINTACRQQGLLHVYKKFCTLGKCRECPLAG